MKGSVLGVTNVMPFKENPFLLVQGNGMIYEQEIYRQFKYKTILNTFHTFEGDVSFYL